METASPSQPVTYQYGPETTLTSLFAAYFATSKTKADDLASRIGATPQLVEQWTQDIPTTGLTTILRGKVEAVTGIDLDRWLVIDAKREILMKDPALASVVSYDRFVTRQEIMDELRRFSDQYGGSKYVSLQIGVDEGQVGHWLAGTHLPAEEHLRKAIIGVSRGLMKGTRNDVLVRLVGKTILGRDLSAAFPGADGMSGLARAFFDTFRDANVTEIARLSGIPRDGIGRLQAPKELAQARFYAETVVRMMRRLVQTHHPDHLDRFNAAAEAYGKDGTVAHPTFAAPNEAAPAAGAHATDGRLASMEAELKRLTDVVDRLTRLPSLATELGVTVDGVEHCLSGLHHRQFPNERLPDEALRLLKGAIGGLRKALVLVSGLDGTEKVRVREALAAEFDELIISIVGTRFYDVIGSAKLIEAQRETVALARKGKK